jgi:hypothetical protein
LRHPDSRQTTQTRRSASDFLDMRIVRGQGHAVA